MTTVPNYRGPTFFFLTVKCGIDVVGTGTLAPGGERAFEWSARRMPGTTVVFNARAWASGAPDLNASGGANIQPWCPSNTYTIVPKFDGPSVVVNRSASMPGMIQWEGTYYAPDASAAHARIILSSEGVAISYTKASGNPPSVVEVAKRQNIPGDYVNFTIQ